MDDRNKIDIGSGGPQRFNKDESFNFTNQGNLDLRAGAPNRMANTINDRDQLSTNQGNQP